MCNSDIFKPNCRQLHLHVFNPRSWTEIHQGRKITTVNNSKAFSLIYKFKSLDEEEFFG